MQHNDLLYCLKKICTAEDQDGDVLCIINEIDRCGSSESCLIPCDLIDRLINKYTGTRLEQELWTAIVPRLPETSLSDFAIEYLIQNKIAVVPLCHKELDNHWLKRLIPFDSAAKITLAKRYYTEERYTDSDFVEFFFSLLFEDLDTIKFILKYCFSCKRLLLLDLCNMKFSDDDQIRSYMIAYQTEHETDAKRIQDIYEDHQEDEIILSAVSANYFTPIEILTELSKITDMLSSRSIRKAASRMLQLKRNINQKYEQCKRSGS